MDKSLEYAFLNELVRQPTLEALAPHLVAHLIRVFDVQTINILRFYRNAPPTLLLTHVPDRNLRNLFDTQYTRIGFSLDPFYNIAFANADITVNRLRDIAPDRFETSEYYARYYAATKLVDEMGAIRRASPKAALHVSLGRDKARGRFRASDMRHFRLLAPIIMNRLNAITASQPETPDMQRAPSLVQRYQRLDIQGRASLSHREAEIAAMIVQGHSSRATGLKLGISDQTVKVHRRNIYKKLRISSQSELFSFLLDDLRGP